MGIVEQNKILAALKSVLKGTKGPVGLHEPSFSGNEWAYLKECLDTGWVSSGGKFVTKFESELSRYTGAKHVSAVVNGTAGLHMALRLVGVQVDDEVLVPDLCFVATANAVAYCKAIPHFCDSSTETLGICPDKLSDWLKEIAVIRGQACFNKKTGRRIKALIVMHTFGHPVDLDRIEAICQAYQIDLIEDAAEALGSYYQKRHVGNHGRVSVLSFNGNKIVTSGGGGAILTNDAEIGKRAKHLTTTAKVSHPWEYNHDEVGYNYRLPNINAALGCAQLESLDTYLVKKRKLAQNYESAFSKLTNIRFIKEPSFANSNYWLNAIVLEKEGRKERDELLKLLNQNNILARPAWTLMHKLPMFKNHPKMLLDRGPSTAEYLEARTICLPSSPFL